MRVGEMEKEIYIHVTKEETKAVVLENGKLMRSFGSFFQKD